MCEDDEGFRADVFCLASRDIIFFTDTFCWTYDPRLVGDGQSTVVPFVTYEYQERVLRELEEVIGKEDYKVKKSRGVGVSWMVLDSFFHRFRFRRGQSFLCVSRNEDYVDSSENTKSLFWKLDFLVRYLPWWMKGTLTRVKKHYGCAETGSVIDGESTTGDVARGDRRTCILLDEHPAFDLEDGYRALASTQLATNSRIFVGTPQGPNNAYADVIRNPSIRGVEIGWWLHPEWRKGLYLGDKKDGRIEIIDKGYVFPDGYGFVADGEYRSPWFDHECLRGTPYVIKTELRMDFGASEAQFFGAELLDKIESLDVKPHLRKGGVDYEQDSLEPTGFVDMEGGHLRVWANLDYRGNLPSDRRYFLGADISFGTQASNSVLSLFDATVGMKVAEYVTPFPDPVELAKQAVVLARWASGADSGSGGCKMIWESNGPGRIFGARVIDLGYGNFWVRRAEERISKHLTDIPGFWSSRDTKKDLLGAYAEALASGLYSQPCLESVQEAREYIILDNGSIVHRASVSTMDPGSAKDNHGDRVIADALSWYAARDERGGSISKEPDRPPYGSYAWRQEEARGRKEEKVYGRIIDG